MKTRLLLCLLLLSTTALWAQSDKRPQPSGQIQQLYERYKQNQTLSKEEYNLLNPYLAEMPADLSEAQAQNRTIGTGGTPQTNAVATAYNFSQTTSTYTPITGGTVLGTGTVDDVNYTGQSIGFTFNYDGVNYTTLGVNSNGFIWFGTAAPATSTYSAISTTGASGSRIIAALSGDLQGLSSGELRRETIGTAPNRICVIQWANFRYWNTTGDNYNFQIRLYETSNRIEIHYGSFTKNATARTYQVGLRGTANTDFNNRTTTTNWSASTAGTVNTATMSLTTTVLPTSGLIFRFNPLQPIDARPTAVTLPAGQLIAATQYDLTVSINNAGLNAISAGYDISYSVNGGPFTTATGVGPALSVGGTATYTFTGLQSLVIPNNEGELPTIRVAVSVPGDGDTDNDSANFASRYFFPTETVFREDFNAGFTGGTVAGPGGVTITAPGWLTINADGSTAAPFFMIPPAVGGLTAFEGNSIANNFNRASGFNIDDYLITPEITGYSPSTDTDSLIFYTRRASNFADSIDIRLSPGISVPAGTTASDFTIRVAYIASPVSPTYQRVAFKLNDFLPGGTTNYRIAFRYLHFDGGPSGGSSDNFAIDAVSIRRSPIPLTASIGVAFGSEAITNGSSTPSLLTGTDFESLPVDNGARSRTFTISNSGLTTLNLTGSPLVQVTGAHASDFTVTTAPSSTVAPAGSTTFTVEFNPTGAGTRTATISIAHDAPNTSTPYTFAVSGVGVTPISVTPTVYFNGFESDAIGTTFSGGLNEVNLVGGIIDWSVIQNGTAPTNTPFAGVRQAQVNTGATFAGETRRLVFPFFSSVGSTNPARLEFAFFKSTLTGADLINVLLSTDGGVSFSTVATVNRTGAANVWEEQAIDLTGTTNNAGFQVAFEAVSAGLGGNRNMYLDNVRISVPSGPEIGVTGNANPIPSGSTTTSLTNHTDFGFANTSAARFGGGNVYPVPIAELGPQEKNASTSSAEANVAEAQGQARMSVKPTETPLTNTLPGTVVRTFTITNTGVDPLTISSVTITGPNASDFSVTTSPAPTVAPSGSTTFQITFNPSTDGVKNATVEIANDDSDENPYTFAIRGEGVTSLPLPYFASLNGTAPGWTVQVVNPVGTNVIYALIGSGVTLPDGSSGGAARANFFSAQSGRVEVLRTPFISLSGATNPVLNFDVAYRSYSGENDRIEVVVSTDGGATYQVGSPVLYNKARNTTPSLATLANSTSTFTPSAASDWRHETVDLSQFAGQTDLLIGFRATSAFGNNAWIANVTIQDVPTVATTNVTGNSTFTGPGGITITFTNFGGTGGNLYFLNFNTAPTSDASTEYATNTSATAPDGTIFTPNVAAPRWWTVTYDGQVLAATINYNVSIDYTGIPGINNPDKLYILRRSNRFGSWVALSTTRSGTVLTATGLTGFSDFGIGGNSGDNPLPVNLSAFTGRNIAQGVELRWQTASETDNAGFDVRCAEVINEVEQEWLTVGTYRSTPSLAGQGTTSQAHNYAYTDAGVQVGKTYRYALRSVDLNGTIHDYPQTVTVEVIRLAPKVYTYKLEQNYPNPFNPTTRIIYQVAATTNVTLEVFDMLGRKVATLVNERKDAGEYSVNFNAQGLSSGVYFYRLQTDKFTQTKKLMLVK